MYTVIPPTEDRTNDHRIYIYILALDKNYADSYFQPSWEDIVLEVTESSVKIMNVTCKTHPAELAAQLPWQVSLASLGWNVVRWISGTIYQPLRSGRIWHKVNF